MYLIVIAWTYVTLMMAVAEATSPVGTVLGAVVTFVLYGVLPMSILVYILSTPSRTRAIKAREAAAQSAHDAAYDAAQAARSQPLDQSDSMEVTGVLLNQGVNTASTQPDAGGKTPAPTQSDAVTPVRKEP